MTTATAVALRAHLTVRARWAAEMSRTRPQRAHAPRLRRCQASTANAMRNPPTMHHSWFASDQVSTRE